VPRRKLDADVGGETVLVPRTRPASIHDRRRRMKWIVAVATVTLGVFALVVFLKKLPDSSASAESMPPPMPPAPPTIALPAVTNVAAIEAPVIPPPPPDEVVPPAPPATVAAPRTTSAQPPRPRPRQPTGPKDDVKRTL
jgi:hypothetical protein